MNTTRKLARRRLRAPALGFLLTMAACQSNTEAPAGNGAAAGNAASGTTSGGASSSAGSASGGVATAGAAGSTTAGMTMTAGAGAGVGGGSAGSAATAGAGGSGGSGGAGGSGGSGGAAAGSGGSGGSAMACNSAGGAGSAYPRTTWSAAYTCTGTCLAGNGDSPNDAPALAFDDNYQTRWSTNRYQQSLWTPQPSLFPLYFTVDMKQSQCVSKITMHPSCRDYYDAPGTVDVLVSLDGTTFTPVVTDHSPVVPKAGDPCPPTAASVATDTISFPAVSARYIQVKATKSLDAAHPGSGDRYWAIGEFNAFP